MPTPSAEASPAGLRAFLIVWAGQVVSLVGTSMSRFALMVWGWQTTGEATTLALLMFANLATTVLLSPVAGAVVDRFDRRKVMIAADFGEALVTAGLLALFLAGRLELAHVYAAAVAGGAFETFQFPAYSAAVTLLVPRRHYGRAAGLNSFAESAARIVGPPLAGILLPVAGMTTIFAIDLATFGVAVAALLAVRLPPPPPSEEGRRARDGLAAEALFGLTYIRERPGLLALQATLAAANFLLIFGIALRAPLILAKTGGDEALLGTVMAAAGAGGVVGGLALAAWGGPRRRVHGVLGGIALAAAGNALLGLGLGAAAWVAGAFLYPLAMSLTNGSNQALWQSKVAPDVQGRVFAARRLIAQATLLPGTLLAGPLADRWLEPALAAHGPGAGIGILAAATAALALAVAVAAAAVPAVRKVEERLPDHVDGTFEEAR